MADRYHDAMSEPVRPNPGFRTGLVDALNASRSAERDVLAGLDPAERDAPAPDGGWSAKDIQAHLAAWKRHQVERMAAIREGRDEPPAESETDAVNARLHAERADWPWDRVLEDAEDVSSAFVAEVGGASDATLALDRISGTILGNGPEHALTHLSSIAARAGATAQSRVLELSDVMVAIIDRGGWPSRASAYARYNLACYHALAGNLDVARSLLRQALPGQESLRTFAPTDDDLIALRDEIPALSATE
jgi:hypothetical protein